MRKKQNGLMPYLAGLIFGYIVTLIAAAAGALIMWAVGAEPGLAWLAAVPAFAIGSFFCGRKTGEITRRNGLKNGFVSGIIYILPLLLLGIVFGNVQWFLLPVKLVLSLIAGAAGGVAGVNSPEV